MMSCSFPATLISYIYPIKWLKDGRDAGFDKEVKSYSTIGNNQKNISLVFEIKDAKQQGNYACMVETLAGRKFTSKNLLLLIKGNLSLFGPLLLIYGYYNRRKVL